MNRLAIRSAVIALALAAGLATAQTPVDTSFSYQGRLTDNGAAPTANYDIKFDLYDAGAGGNLLGTQSFTIPVVNGLFSTPLDFGPQFGTQKRWLQISVRPGNTQGSFTPLATRQLLTGAPYSIGPWRTTSGGPYPTNGYYLFAGDNSYFGMDGDYGDIHVNGGNDGAFGFNSDGPPSGSFNILTGGTTRLTIRNDTGNVGIGDINPAYAFTVRTSGGGVAVYGGTDTGRGVAGFATGAGWGTSGDNSTYGTYGILGSPNEGVFGAANSTARYGGHFFNSANNNAAYLTGANQAVYGASTNGRGVEGWSTNAVGVSGDCTGAATSGQLGTPNEGVYAAGGLVHRGLTAGSGAEDGIVTTSGGINKSGIAAFSNNGGGYGGYFHNNAGGIALFADGVAQVRVLQIIGGSDLAEPFDVNPANATGAAQAQPGMVVVIDSERAGQLRLADAPYDTKVAGVISGANGLAPGMVMKAQGQDMADGKYPVAMTGRVWCWVDASYGGVALGDRLTTSATPGHAMKAGDTSRTGGTVIGKAMTELKEGKGLVLVLVNLQ